MPPEDLGSKILALLAEYRPNYSKKFHSMLVKWVVNTSKEEKQLLSDDRIIEAIVNPFLVHKDNNVIPIGRCSICNNMLDPVNGGCFTGWCPNASIAMQGCDLIPDE